MSCVLRSACVVLYLLAAGTPSFSVHAVERLQFSHWEFELPETLVKTTSTSDRLVLRLVPGLPGSATITFYAPQPVQGDPAKWLDAQWQKLSAGHQIIYEAELGEAALMDGSAGLRRSANTGNGEGFLQADAYPVADGTLLMVMESQGEQGMLAFVTLLPSLRLINSGKIPEFTDEPNLPQAVVVYPPRPVIKPPQIGPDPYDSINWKGNGVRLRTTADLEEIEIRSTFNSFINNNKVLLGGVKSRPVSFADAMATVRSLVGTSFSAGHLTALREYPNFQNREKLLDSAAGVLMKGQTNEALARLMLAYERWPNDPEVLFNTAALLSQGRLVNESLAIIDEMERKGKLPGISFGIDSQAGMDYLRGYNLMQLGSYAEADVLISKVVNNEPDFAEASLTAALLAYELGKKPTTFFINGFYRRSNGQMKSPGQETETKSDSPSEQSKAEDESTKPVPEEDIFDDDSVVLSAIHFVDVSRGTPGKLPSIYQPTTIEDSLKFQDWFKSQLPMFTAEVESMSKQVKRLDNRWRNKIPPGPQYEYYEEILRMFTEANARMPEIQRLLRAQNRGIQDSTEAGGRLNDWFLEKYLLIQKRHKLGYTDPCPDVKALVLETHDSLRVHVQYIDLATRRLHRLWHRYVTALGTMVSDPDFRNYLTLDINFANQTEYAWLVANMYESTAYAGYARECIAKKSSREWGDNLEDSALASCDDGATAGLGVSYGPVTVSSSCEGFTIGLEFDVGPVEVSSETEIDKTGEVQKQTTGGKVDLGPLAVSGRTSRDKKGKDESSVGVEGGIPGLKGKGEITMDNQGSTSVYVGGKAGDEFEGAGVKVGASQESGVVVTVKDGSVSDVALKSTTSVTAKVGGSGVNVSETRTLSFMPGPSVNRGSLPMYKG